MRHPAVVEENSSATAFFSLFFNSQSGIFPVGKKRLINVRTGQLD